MKTNLHSPKLKQFPRAGWDTYDAYLFDIDGTLLRCADAVHYFAFCEALSEFAGYPLNLDGVTAHGNTDTGILRDAFLLGKVGEVVWRPEIRHIHESMCRYVEEHQADLVIEVLPSVVAVLNHLRSKGALLGVATGNLEFIGRAKLARCGLLDCFDFGGYSDEYENRRDVFCGALTKARHLTGSSARVCVVGDTPEDIRSAQFNNLDVIAVATGIFGVEDLRDEKPDWCLNSLAELLTETIG
jgi:phosphoglycolate phosphatase